MSVARTQMIAPYLADSTFRAAAISVIPMGRLATPEELIGEIERTLRSGVPVVLASARNFDYQPPEAVKPDSHGSIPYELYKTLISRIDPALRKNLFFAGSLGGEIVLFDAVKGEPIPYIKSFWDLGEKEQLLAVVDKALADYKLAAIEDPRDIA